MFDSDGATGCTTTELGKPQNVERLTAVNVCLTVQSMSDRSLNCFSQVEPPPPARKSVILSEEIPSTNSAYVHGLEAM
jgi:hypothetical protein